MFTGFGSTRRKKGEFDCDPIGLGKREAHLFGVRESLSNHSSFTECSDRLPSEWPWVDLPEAFAFVCLTKEQIDVHSIGKRGTGELEFCGSTAAEFQRKQIPNGNQIAIIGQDLGGNGVLEQRIAAQRFARLFLMLSLCLEEVNDLGSIRF